MFHRAIGYVLVCGVLGLMGCAAERPPSAPGDVEQDRTDPNNDVPPNNDGNNDVNNDGPNNDVNNDQNNEPNNDVNNDGPNNDVNNGFNNDVIPTPEGAFILQGAVLTPDGVIDPGHVLVVEDTIFCVADDCTQEPEALDAVIIDTRGVISPGLIDAHNHLPYNFLPEWIPPRSFTNRYQWADDPGYEEHIRPFTAHRSSNSHFCPAARWGELRSLLHGTTTIMGQSFERTCTSGWVRNADHNHDLQHDHMRTTIGSVRDINDDAAQGYIDSFNQPGEPVTRFAVHMAEGISDNRVDEEFESFVGRDPRPNRHAGQSLMVGGTSVLIHSVAVTDDHLLEIAEADAKIVWSPSSNMVLYGDTADIGRILELGITTGLGPDWTVSGEDNMLAEMRFAADYGQQMGVDAVDAERLWRMATVDGADVVGLAGFVGRLEAGQRADIVVFARKNTDPYESVLQNRARDVRLVLIDGQGFYGDEALLALARHDQCEIYDVCGSSRFICVKEPDAVHEWSQEGIGDIRQQLLDILEGTPDAPDDEQYGRGDELLELVDCQE